MVTLILPADTKFAAIERHWHRWSDGRILAHYTPDELFWALALAGYDAAAVRVRELVQMQRKGER